MCNMTDSDIRHLTTTTEDIKRLVELQNSRVRKNQEELIVNTTKIEMFEKRLEDILSELRGIRVDFKMLVDKEENRHTILASDIHNLQTINAGNEGMLGWAKKNGITILMFLAVVIFQVLGFVPSF